MALFALVGHDGPRGRELRAVHRPAHLERWRALVREDRVRFVGPLLADGAPVGSLIVFEATDLAAARAVAAGDPYVVHGVFARYEVHETRDVLPELGG